MKAVVYVNTQQVGTAELYADDILQGCIRGTLQPNEHYQATVNMRMNVQLENGHFPMMNTECRIGSENDGKSLELVMKNMSVEVVDYVRRDDTKCFIEDVWSSIDIDQKIAFEDELQREIKNRKRSFFGLGPVTNTHPLDRHRTSALAKADMNDDVLYIVRDSAGSERYAVVHLTWSNNKEDTPAFPATAVFDTLDDFKNSCYENR